MKYVIKNGIILNGTKDMEPVYDKDIYIDGEKIEKIADKAAEIPSGYIK